MLVREPRASARSDVARRAASTSGSGPSSRSDASRASCVGAHARAACRSGGRPGTRAGRRRRTRASGARAGATSSGAAPFGPVEPAPAHAEVGEQREAGVEVEQQELARAPRLAERAARAASRAAWRATPCAAAGATRSRCAMRAPRHVRGEHAAHGLDFGEFGHDGAACGAPARRQERTVVPVASASRPTPVPPATCIRSGAVRTLTVAASRAGSIPGAPTPFVNARA